MARKKAVSNPKKTTSRPKQAHCASTPVADMRSGGSDGYRGYEYQILATVWLALDLMTTGKADAIIVEPPSQEDVDVYLNVPAVKADSVVSLTHVSIQIKYRSGSAWTKSKLRLVLEPKPQKGTAKPLPRIRPLQRLTSEPALHYVLLTNAALEPDLAGVAIAELEELPRDWQCKWVPPLNADAVRRIGVLAEKTRETLQLRVEKLLQCPCYVPRAKLAKCYEALANDIRDRLLKPMAGAYTRKGLFDRISEYGAPFAKLSEPVLPANYAEIQKRLDSRHALLLVGEPGSGKTTLAEWLVESLERQDPPHERFVVKSPGDIPDVRRLLQAQDNHVFYFEDPWGKYAINADAAAMVSAILEFVGKARPGKVVIITSCTHVFKAAFGGDESEIKLYVLGLEGRNYRPEDYQKIYLRQLDGWSEATRRAAQEWMHLILAQTVTPLAVRAACMALATRLREVRRVTAREVTALAIASNVGHAAQVVHSILKSEGLGGVPAGVAVWAALSGTESRVISADCVRTLRGAMQDSGAKPPPLERVMLLLADAGRMQRVESGYSAHSSTCEALARLADQHPDTWRDTLGCIFRGWVRSGGSRAVLMCMKTDQRVTTLVPRDAEADFRRFLLERLIKADDHDIGLALDDIARFLRRDSPAVVLAHLLTRREIEPESRDWAYHLLGGPKWMCDATLAEDVSAMRESEDCVKIGRRFVLDYLPRNAQRPASQSVFEPALLVPFLRQFGWPLEEWFSEAFKDALRLPTEGCAFLAECLCEIDPGGFGAILDLVLETLKSANEVYNEVEDKFRKEAQGEVDARPDWPDYDSDYAESLNSACEALVRWKRIRDGFAWIGEHARTAEVLRAWAGCLEYDYEASRAEHAAFLETCERFGMMAIALPVMRKHPGDVWHVALARYVLALRVVDAHPLLDALEVFVAVPEFQAEIGRQAAAVSFPQRALSALILEGRLAVLDHGNPCEIVPWFLSADERPVIRACRAACDEKPVSNRFQPDDVARLWTLVEEWPDLYAVHAWEVALRSEASAALRYIKRFLKSNYPAVRAHAWRLCVDRSGAIEKGLADPDYRCRRAVLVNLAPSATQRERDRLLSLETDASAYVREALAKVIGEQRWQEGVNTLTRLLRDNRDYAPQCDEGYALAYNVARAACTALHALPVLQENTLGQVQAFLNQCTDAGRDAEVHGLLFRILAQYPSATTFRFCSDYVDETWWISKWPKCGGADILVQCLHAVAELLQQSPNLAQSLKTGTITKLAHMDEDRDFVAHPALVVLALADDTIAKQGEAFEKDEAFGEDRARLLLLTSSILQRDRPQWLMQHIQKDDPCFAFVNWACAQPRAQAYDEYSALNPDVAAWLQSLEKASMPKSYIRWAAKRLIGQAKGNDLSDLPHPFRWPQT